MNKVGKKILTIILIIILISFFTSNIYASVYKLNPTYTPSSGSIKGFGEELFGIIRNVAAISSVVLLAFCGMKIVFGSLEQRAEYKKSLMPLIIGSLVVLSATAIVSLVENIIV